MDEAMQYYERYKVGGDLKAFCEKWNVKDFQVEKSLAVDGGKSSLSIRAGDHSYKFSIEALTGYVIPECPDVPEDSELEERRERFQKRLADLRSKRKERDIEINNLQMQIATINGGISSLSKRSDARIDTLENQVEVLRELIEEQTWGLNGRIAGVDGRLSNLVNNLEEALSTHQHGEAIDEERVCIGEVDVKPGPTSVTLTMEPKDIKTEVEYQVRAVFDGDERTKVKLADYYEKEDAERNHPNDLLDMIRDRSFTEDEAAFLIWNIKIRKESNGTDD